MVGQANKVLLKLFGLLALCSPVFGQQGSLREISPEVFPTVLLEAHLQDGEVRLSWTGDQDSMALFYEVERSADAEHFEPVSHIDAVHASCLQQYETSDRFPPEGLWYYRIKVVWHSEYHYSGIVAVEHDPIPSFLLKKAPGSPLTFRFESEKTDEAALVILYDVYGNELFSKIVISSLGQEQVYLGADASGTVIPPGVYYIAASNERGYYHKKLVVS